MGLLHISDLSCRDIWQHAHKIELSLLSFKLLAMLGHFPVSSILSAKHYFCFYSVHRQIFNIHIYVLQNHSVTCGRCEAAATPLVEPQPCQSS